MCWYKVKYETAKLYEENECLYWSLILKTLAKDWDGGRIGRVLNRKTIVVRNTECIIEETELKEKKEDM